MSSEQRSILILVVIRIIMLVATTKAQEPTPPRGITFPDDTPINLAESQLVLEFEAGSFLEGIATDAEGMLYVTVLNPLTDGGQIWKLDPFKVIDYRGVTADLFADARGSNLAFGAEGTLYATVQSGSFTDPTTLRTHLSRFSPEGIEEVLVEFPAGSSPNGITFDEQGNFYAADSLLGLIWRLPEGVTTLEAWLEADALLPQGLAGIPGINGIEVFNGYLYTVNSSSGEFLRIPIEADGSAGAIEVVATGIPGDGFVIDPTGTAYITTNPFNSVIKLLPDGQKEVVGMPQNQIVGATDIVLGKGRFGVGALDFSQSIYIVQGGGIINQLLPSPVLDILPETTRAEVGVAGIIRLDYPNRLNCSLLPPVENILTDGPLTEGAYLGGREGSRDSVEQIITVPERAILTYQWEIVGSRTRSWLAVTVTPLGGAETSTKAIFTHHNATAPLGRQQTCLDLSAYTGQEVTLTFEQYNDFYTMTAYSLGNIVIGSLPEKVKE